MDHDGTDLNIFCPYCPEPLQTVFKVLVEDAGERVFIKEDLQEREIDFQVRSLTLKL